MLPPFEMAVREGGARSVMNSYTEIDGVPAPADPALLTGCCATSGASTGTVVADYCGDRLPARSCTASPATPAEAGRARRWRPASTSSCRTCAATASRWSRRCATGRVPEELRRPRRAPGAAPEGRARPARPGLVARTSPAMRRRRARTSTRPAHRALARGSPRRRSCCWPTTARCRCRRRGRDRAGRPVRRRPARVPRLLLLPQPRRHAGPPGPRPRHRGPDAARRAARRAAGRSGRATSRAARSSEPDRSASPAAVEAAARGRRVRRGARRPGRAVRARHLRRGLRRRGPLAARRPGRAARGAARRPARRSCSSSSPAGPTRSGATPAGAAAIVQAFFPGEEGGAAIAGVLSGTREPSRQAARAGPARPGRPAEHLPAPAARRQQRAGSATSTRRRCSRSATGCRTRTFDYVGLRARRRGDRRPTARSRCSCTVRNAGDRAGAEVVQLYLPDPVATRDPARSSSSIGFARVPLEAGRERSRRRSALHADRTAFTGTDLRRIVEPGEIRLMVGSSSEDIRARGSRPPHRRHARRRRRPRAHDAVLGRTDPALTVRIGLIGYGFGGRRFHAPFIEERTGLRARRRGDALAGAPSGARARSPRRTRVRQPGRGSRPPASTRSSSPRRRRRTPR